MYAGPMKSAPRAIRIAVIFLTVLLFLNCQGAGQSTSPATPNHSAGEAKALPRMEDIPPCSATAGDSTRKTTTQSNQPSHSVTLSWNASVPASASPHDAVKGYYVYRNRKSHRFSEHDRMNAVPLQGTHCVDRAVTPKRTYHYAVKAIAENGRKSDYSQPITAIIPSP
jgi:hypothetical protein